MTSPEWEETLIGALAAYIKTNGESEFQLLDTPDLRRIIRNEAKRSNLDTYEDIHALLDRLSAPILNDEAPAFIYEEAARQAASRIATNEVDHSPRVFKWASSLVPARLSNEEIGDMTEALVAAGFTGWQYRLRVAGIVVVLFWNAIREEVAGFVAKRRGGS